MDFKRKNINLSMVTDIREKDTGLGTSYERWSLYNLLEKLYFIHDFKTVLEGPADGMSGIKGLNSLILARLNCRVDICLPGEKQIEIAKEICDKYSIHASFTKSDNFRLPFSDSSCDLVWNFCIAHILNPEELLEEMIRISKKYVMVIVPNPENYGFILHRINHLITGDPWVHGNIEYMHIRKWSRLIKKKGLRIIDRFLVDIPFWPDIDKPPETIIGDFLPFLKNWLNKKATERYDTTGYSADNLPYFGKNEEFERLMEKLSFIERNFPGFIKILFAHHNGILAGKV